MNLRAPHFSSSLLRRSWIVIVAVLVAVLAACGDDGAVDVVVAPTQETPTPPAPTPTTIPTPTPEVPTSEAPTTPAGVIDDRVAFLVDFLNDPASISDAALAEHFAPSFLAAIAPTDLRAAVVQAAAAGRGPWTAGDGDLSATGGSLVLTSADGMDLTLVFELEATGSQQIVLAQLLPGSVGDVEEALADPGTFDEVDAALGEAASRVTYGVFEASDGACTLLRAREADVAAPMGSSFKLWVLATLARAIRDGDAAWEETIEIDGALRSSPDGEIYALDDGTPVTLQYLAEAMISISDNTATDHLIDRLGRPAIEATMAELGVSAIERNTPFLSTGELFKLKFVDPSLGDRYLALADSEERRAFLDGEVAATPLPWIADPAWVGDADLLATPQRIDELEWFATPLDLCATFLDLDALAAQPGLEPVAAILEENPGLPIPERQWSTVRFKGGSEPGVIMFAYWLEAPTGERRVVTVSLSDPDVAFAEMAAAVPVARLLALVAEQL